jgi:ribosomal protein S18 acetylase RimI-like enzyme
MDIRLLTLGDLDGALTLSSTAGWNQRLADWRMLLRLASTGSFAAVTGGRIVGTAIGIDYGSFAWIAMMLVDPAYRGQGLGARLLEAAMGAVPPDHTIRLDATPMGRSLYQRYGFEDEAMLSRNVSDTERGARNKDTGSVRGMTAADVPAVMEIDRRVFGGDRRALLEWALEEAPEYAKVIDSDAGCQYCFGRTGRLFDQIGPVVATTDADAAALLEAALLSVAGKAAVADVYDAQSRFATCLQRRGFVAQRPLFRMRRPGSGGVAAPSSPDGANAVEYAIFGPEFA